MATEKSSPTINLEGLLAACQSLFTPGGTDPHEICTRRFDGPSGLTQFGGYAPTPKASRDFTAKIKCRRYGSIAFGILSHSGGVNINLGDHFQHDHRVTRLSVLLDGRLTAYFDHHAHASTAGCGVLIPGATSFNYTAHSGIRALFLDIAVDNPEFGQQAASMAHWPGQRRGLSAVACFVEALLTNPVLHYQDRIDARHRLEALIHSVLATAPITDPETAANRLHGDAIQYMKVHHTNAMLDVAGVARGLGVSKRALQREFTDDELKVSEWLQKFRTETALSHLAVPGDECPCLEDVAHRSGFTSACRLREAVRATTGLTPSAYRRSKTGGVTE